MGPPRSLVVLLPLLVAFGGCLGSDEGPRESRDGDHVHGLFFVCDDGTVIDPGSYSDHHKDNFEPSTKCPLAEAAASVDLVFEKAQLTLYETTRYDWTVTPKGDTEAVANVTQVRVSANASEDRQVKAQPKAIYGESIDERSVVELPAQLDGEWQPRKVGVYFFRAYAEVAGKHVWSSELSVEVVPIAPSGIVHEVTIETAVPAPETDPEILEMVAGDSVVFVNDDVIARRLHTVTAPEEFDTGDIPAGGESDEIVLLTPGTYTYRSDDPAPIRGEIRAAVPQSG